MSKKYTNIIESLKKIPEKKAKEALLNIVTFYMQPAFGSMQKRDFEINLFIELQKLNVIPKNPDLYELLRDLKITRSKARTLLYESKLRTDDIDLDEELKDLLSAPRFEMSSKKEEDPKIILEIEDPCLIDHIRHKLKTLKCISDTSFSPELLKLNLNAYTKLIDDCAPDELKTNLLELCKKDKNITVKGLSTFTGILTQLIKAVAKDKLGDNTSNLIENVIKYKINEHQYKIKEIFNYIKFN